MAGAAIDPGLKRYAPAAATFAMILALALVASSLQQPPKENWEDESPGKTDAPPAQAPSCSENQTRECEISGCIGVMRCLGGEFGSCQLPKKICRPFSKVACNIDGCRFGYRICNGCGTEFGECIENKNFSGQCDDGCR